MRLPSWLNTALPDRRGITHVLSPAILMAVLWWVLTDGQAGSWVVGIPVVILATGASLWFHSHELWNWRLAGLVRFLPVFIWQSVRAGFQVAILAFHPRCPLAPGLLTYRLRLPAGPSRIFFTNTMSLSPGSFSADLEEDRLIIHVLDEQFLDQEEWQSMELLVADLFGVQLAAGNTLQSDRHE
jgi:multicomponent Na+:H+ antiporter subunit E